VDVVLIALGQKARLEVEAFRDRKFIGTVTEIANSSRNLGQDSRTGSGGGGGGGQQQEATRFEVKVRIKDKETFRPGMSVTSEIETRSRTNVLTVPIQCVTTRLPKGKDGKPLKATNAPTVSGANATGGDKKTGDQPKPVEVVFLADGEKAKMTPVKAGISDENYSEIIEGLQEGQEVISGGYKAISRDLENGKKIKRGEPEKEQKK
jgi:HlyD family secretion protein